jgi:hypothetical protein
MQGSLRFLSVLVAVLAIGSTVLARPEPNAFLNRRVQTVEQLIDQVQRDREVRDRYMRHYGMSQAELVAFFRTLRIQPLAQEGVFTVYSVPEDGVIKVRTARLRRGELVLVDPAGQPVMQLSCGNPLGLGAGLQHTMAPVMAPIMAEVVEMREVPIEIAVAPEEAMTLMATAPGIPVVPPAPPVAPPPPPPVIIDERPLVPVATAGGFSPLIPVGILGALLIPRGETRVEPIQVPTGAVAVVPEPASAAALLLGVGALAARRRKK